MAFCALILLVPIFLFIAFVIKLRDYGPVFFKHQRVGSNGKPFWCIKFRTMAVNSEQALAEYLASNEHAAQEWTATQKLKNDPRITPFGRSLRKTSLDELPQLLNILKGEMSLVGPRPIVSSELPKYGHSISHYLCARPGLTGAWQVSGRNDVDYRSRVMLDRQYVENWNFCTDLLIIAKTFRTVLNGRGCY
jgi:exopolysaccharide production protein ExoY